MLERGLIEPLTSKELLMEMYSILEKTTFNHNPIIFRANHVSNMHPIGGTLPRDLNKTLRTLSDWIEHTPDNSYPNRPSSM